jgi:hypothetical protein
MMNLSVTYSFVCGIRLECRELHSPGLDRYRYVRFSRCYYLKRKQNSPETMSLEFPSLFNIGDYLIYVNYLLKLPITVAAQSKAWTVFAHPNTGIMSSNPTWGMDVCLRLFRVCVVLRAGSGLATGWLSVLWVLPTVYGLRNWKSGEGPTKGSRTTYR